MNKSRKRNRSILVILLLTLALYAGWQIVIALYDYRQEEKHYRILTEQFIIPERDEQETVTAASESDYEDSAEPPITVDFQAILSKCPDVIGWLYSPDTPINYPVVQTGDNDYYMYHMPDGTESDSGSIFLDCRNKSDFSDWNHILYGHNMKNDTMFGALQDYKRQEYYDEHSFLYLLTPTGNYRIDFIGGCTVSENEADMYAIPAIPEERDELIRKVRERTAFRTELPLEERDRLIMLSTCAYDYEGARYILAGVLRAISPAESSPVENRTNLIFLEGQ